VFFCFCARSHHAHHAEALQSSADSAPKWGNCKQHHTRHLEIGSPNQVPFHVQHRPALGWTNTLCLTKCLEKYGIIYIYILKCYVMMCGLIPLLQNHTASFSAPSRSRPSLGESTPRSCFTMSLLFSRRTFLGVSSGRGRAMALRTFMVQTWLQHSETASSSSA
jgi:hypothetical protein